MVPHTTERRVVGRGMCGRAKGPGVLHDKVFFGIIGVLCGNFVRAGGKNPCPVTVDAVVDAVVEIVDVAHLVILVRDCGVDTTDHRGDRPADRSWVEL